MTRKNGNLASMEQSQKAKRGNLVQWRAQHVHEETLPSGLEVTLRDVDLPSIMMSGDIPNTLVELIASEDFQKLSEQEATKQVVAKGSDFNTFMRLMVTAAMVEPAIGDTADDNHILYSELTFTDKMFVFNYMNREAAALRPFREGEAEPVTIAQPG